MRVVLKIVLGLVGLVAALFVGVVIYVRIGPTGPVPKVDPLISLNQAHADLADNAAPLYLAAHELLVPPADERWLTLRVDWEAETDAIAAWIEQNAGCIEQARAATELPDCWFELERRGQGPLELAYIPKVKALMRLCWARGRIAADQHDLRTLEESLLITDAIARHVLQQPCIIPHLVGIAGLAHGQDLVLLPLRWPELAEADRSAYFAEVKDVFESAPSAVTALQTERDEMCWNPWYRGYEPGLFMPPRRVAGEVDRYFAPVLDLARQSPEELLAPDNPLYAELSEIWSRGASLSNPVRSEIAARMPALRRFLEIRARLIATQRGNATVVAIFEHQGRAGSFPEDLGALHGQRVIDPFTGEPFIYRHTHDTFMLYSAGVDRDDDGGLHDRRFGERFEEPPDGDYVFWPLPD